MWQPCHTTFALFAGNQTQGWEHALWRSRLELLDAVLVQADERVAANWRGACRFEDSVDPASAPPCSSVTQTQ